MNCRVNVSDDVRKIGSGHTAQGLVTRAWISDFVKVQREAIGGYTKGNDMFRFTSLKGRSR